MNNSTLRSTLITLTSFIFVITAVQAWTGPSVLAPDGNVSAPLTISATSQSKTGGLDVGWLSAVGAVKVGYTATACSADLAGSLRWNTGVMEYCNGTVWGPFVGTSSGGGGGGDTPYCAFKGKTARYYVPDANYGFDCSITINSVGVPSMSIWMGGFEWGCSGSSVDQSTVNTDPFNNTAYCPGGYSGSANFNTTTGVLTCTYAGHPLVNRTVTQTITPDPSLCNTGGGSTAETDPTVLASVKDGVSWGEVTGKPADMSETGSLCGWSYVVPCKGHNTAVSCPSGYTQYQLVAPSGWDSGGYMNPGTYSCVKN